MNQTLAWTPADISSIVNIGLTFIVMVINLHQSYENRYFHFKCMGCEIEKSKSQQSSREPSRDMSRNHD